MTVEILYFDGCPHHRATADLVREVVGSLGVEAEIRQVRVETPEEALRKRFVGSPSVRVNGKDVEPGAEAETDFALSCRRYGESGVPPRELLVAALSAIR